MLPSNDRLYLLFDHYLNNRIADDELKELFDYIHEAGENNLLREEIIDVFKNIRQDKESYEVDWERMYQQITGRQSLVRKKNIRRLNVWKKVAAAVLILIIGGGGYLFIKKQTARPHKMLAAQTTNDVLPGGNKATLTLSNGKTIILNNANNGKLVNTRMVNVVKVNNGMIAYQANTSASLAHATVQYNTLTVPRGGQYRLTLSDGTKVWLNAASSIRYPIVFTGKERIVEVAGEAYFEVAKNVSKPFIVRTLPSSDGHQKGAEVQVLGTHFNVNAYGDNNKVEVTLLEGLIKVQLRKGGHQSVIVHPSEQAQLNETGTIKLVKNVRVNDVISWKNGFFSFRNDDLEEVLRKLSRWYDVDVVYQPGVNNKQHFSGRIDRNLTLSQVLKGLELTQAHFKIEANRKLEILP